jgi:hypothetical protein
MRELFLGARPESFDSERLRPSALRSSTVRLRPNRLRLEETVELLAEGTGSEESRSSSTC